MIEYLKMIFVRESFQPGFWGLFINPFYFSRKELCKKIKILSRRLTGRVLDIGCGQKPYKHFFCNASEYIGIEVDTPHNRKNKKADYYFDGKALPFSDNSFDNIFLSQVLEHVFLPDSFLTEINRVMKEEGELLLSVPFVWDEHEQPLDYARYSSYGICALLERNAFCIVEQHKTATDLQAIFQLLNVYIYKSTISKNRWLNLLAMIILMAPINICGVIFSRLFPSNTDFYLDNIVVAKKKLVV